VISSTAAITGGEFCSAYAAAKFGVEGWMESLTLEVAPFGIHTMIIEPGFLRTGLLTPESTTYAEPSIEDYAERTRQTVTAWSGVNGRPGGDPANSPARSSGSRARTSRRCGSRSAPTRSPLSSRRRRLF
jgi:NAD(P)-dependent dehydrogenase (short-subunit alcohol dehydrogenase family)